MKFLLLFICISIAIVSGAEGESIRDKRETFAQGLEKTIREEFDNIINKFFLVVHEIIENMTQQQDEISTETTYLPTLYTPEAVTAVEENSPQSMPAEADEK